MLLSWLILHTVYTREVHTPNEAAALMNSFRQKEGPPPPAAEMEPPTPSGEVDLPYCDWQNHAIGEWEYDASITQAPYVSNEWDNVCDTTEGYHNVPSYMGDKFAQDEDVR